MERYSHLKVWTKAHALVLNVYKATARFPISERYGLTAQLRRSTVSIAANIVEGYGRGTDRAFAGHIQIARGSANESEYHLFLARDLGYLDGATYEILAGEARQIGCMLTSLRRTLRTGGPGGGELRDYPNEGGLED